MYQVLVTTEIVFFFVEGTWEGTFFILSSQLSLAVVRLIFFSSDTFIAIIPSCQAVAYSVGLRSMGENCLKDQLLQRAVYRVLLTRPRGHQNGHFVTFYPLESHPRWALFHFLSPGISDMGALQDNPCYLYSFWTCKRDQLIILLIWNLYFTVAASMGAPVRQSRHHHTFYRQPSCTFSYYGRVGNHRYRYRRANAALLIKPSRSMNDLYEVEARHRRRSRQRNRHRSGNTNSSSGDTESEEGEVRIFRFLSL